MRPTSKICLILYTSDENLFDSYPTSIETDTIVTSARGTNNLFLYVNQVEIFSSRFILMVCVAIIFKNIFRDFASCLER